MKIIKKPNETSAQIDILRQQIAKQQEIIEYLLLKVGDKAEVKFDEEQK